MRTLLTDPPPPELQEPLSALLARRHEWGADVHDEVWEGVLHMAPAPTRRHAIVQLRVLALLEALASARGMVASAEFNLGDAGDFRVPDGGLHRPGPDALYNPTAALVLEVISPGDDSWKKLPFYAAHRVDEVLIVDPDERAVHWLALADGDYHEVDRSALVDLGSTALAEQLDPLF